jgi:hypothetical protein
MRKVDCLYAKRGCQFASHACNGSLYCSEKDRRMKLNEMPCPITKELGFKDCSCDIPDVRALVPASKKCFFNGKCAVREVREISIWFAKEQLDLSNCGRKVTTILRHAVQV